MKIGEKNVGKVDKMIRVVLGLGLVIGGYMFFVPLLSYVVMLAGAVLTVTGFLGTCTLYTILGINTLGKK
ncbi:Uncharacterised protein [Candidatus Bilamarchaeum dharawalense]|uniref:Inner membrane protein YgaP-like transmembrane domain-containing protein n=1 Tax=Candidatus Bilamarchaeum dharawalense TaxID=2885759 RepID=A0A5E4LR03_9ARCH|nr:Uncharacterised protein [Candidatus Bilamarchaeum dharawalense]